MTDDDILYTRVRVLRAEMNAYAETVRRRIDAIEAKYSPDQSRDDHGRWDGGDGNGSGDGSGDSTSQLSDAIDYLTAHAEDDSVGKCATYVREALNAGNIDVGIPSVRPGEDAAQARDYGPMLTDAGFEPAFNSSQPATSPDPSQLEAGDVVVIQSTSRNAAGHMAMYDG